MHSIRQQIIDKLDLRFKAIVTAETFNSIRQQIINLVDNRFKTILVTGGYKMNLGNNIFAWRDTPIQLSEMPALVYSDRLENKESLTFGKNIRKLTIDVVVYAVTTAQIRECIADIEKAVYTDETWGGLALSTEFDANEMEIEQLEKYFAATKISIVVNYTTQMNDPYVQ